MWAKPTNVRDPHDRTARPSGAAGPIVIANTRASEQPPTPASYSYPAVAPAQPRGRVSDVK